MKILLLCFTPLFLFGDATFNAQFFGIFSLLPPIIAITLAFITKDVILSLFIGALSGGFMLALVEQNIFYALVNSFVIFVKKAVESLANTSNAGIILQMLTIGGMVALITKMGGTKAVATWFAKKAKKAKSSQLATWFMGCFIFFDDYANSFIVGPIMRPLTDKFKISREKLAFIMDSTAAPIAGLAIISTWIGFELSVIKQGYDLIDDKLFLALNQSREQINAFEIFIQTLPYRFYNILMLAFVLFTILQEREFGPMLQAQRHAKNIDFSTIQNASENLEDKLLEPKEGIDLKASNATIPLGILIVFSFVGFYFSGYANIEDTNLKAQIELAPLSLLALRETFSSADTATALFQAAFLASIVAIIMGVYRKIFTLKEGIMTWTYGWRMMIITVIILMCAWPLSSVIKDLGTSIYLVDLLSDTLPLYLLPLIVFLLSSVVSLSTGTSYGTMGILMPLTVPLAIGLGVHNELMDAQLHHYMVINISAVLTGAIFGDHCSPISDTTILSSMASKCELLAHVKTQMPYAIFICFISLFAGYLPVTLGLSVWIVLPLDLILIFILLRIFGKKT
ncbi:Na+/H+ antiporter NhaC family protein [Campylobacter upsaliensis]|uniref:Na+/H+ antiporter family protein n=1 Tax=Campylobacter upsaliensis TaxID=28080 RepID=A0A448KN09_CAMUP|nr:Na+/H+ antiporter NhaC family protein [Campylobacter upsaliensis]MCA5588547.1 Na+/H+ antiporter NhaC family protein [Campylobacter upsaliensis]VEG84775.1 Na+/H+ antiporter family protein [Campylobacter upsaliensis]